MRCLFTKAHGGTLAPADDAAHRLLSTVKLGAGVAVEAKKARNVGFHRKFFSLLKLAFDLWDPPPDRLWKGVTLRKDFDQFRADILILAGYYDASYRLDGSVKLAARSISFASCDEHEFHEVYSKVLDVVWDRILRDAHFSSKAEAENAVNQLMAYD